MSDAAPLVLSPLQSRGRKQMDEDDRRASHPNVVYADKMSRAIARFFHQQISNSSGWF